MDNLSNRNSERQATAMSSTQNTATDMSYSTDENSGEESSMRYSSAFAPHNDNMAPSGFSRFQSSPPSQRPSTPPAARPQNDTTNDSMLSRYFRDMATHSVMGSDEELAAAKSVEDAEVEHWVALLS